jgi:hypothetical protein
MRDNDIHIIDGNVRPLILPCLWFRFSTEVPVHAKSYKDNPDKIRRPRMGFDEFLVTVVLDASMTSRLKTYLSIYSINNYL